MNKNEIEDFNLMNFNEKLQGPDYNDHLVWKKGIGGKQLVGYFSRFKYHQPNVGSQRISSGLRERNPERENCFSWTTAAAVSA